MNKLVWLNLEILDNPLREILMAGLILLSGFILKRYVAILLSRQSYIFVKRFSHNQFVNEFVALIRRPVEQFLALLILYFAIGRLHFPEEWAMAGSNTLGVRWAILVVYKIAVLVVGTRLMLQAAEFASIVIYHNKEGMVSKELVFFIKELIKVVLVILSIFGGLRFIFNVNITALIASLGIGGLAVALAAQDTLANLLGSFIIYLDSPFKQGDNIEFGETSGTVEHVGFRTTRIRTFNKSLLIVPNKKIVDSILNNITSSDMRRVKFELSLTYATTPEQISKVVESIREEIKRHPKTTEDAVVRFMRFEESSLNILVAYFTIGNDYETMVEVREEINLAIMKIIQTQGCEFAFPTRTVMVDNKPGNQLSG